MAMTQSKPNFHIRSATVSGVSAGGSRTVTGMTATCEIIQALHHRHSDAATGLQPVVDITASVTCGAGAVTITPSTSVAANGAVQMVTLLFTDNAK